MLHQTDEKPLEYWVHRLFPDAKIKQNGNRFQLIETNVEISPSLPENELLIWLDGVEATILRQKKLQWIEKANK